MTVVLSIFAYENNIRQSQSETGDWAVLRKHKKLLKNYFEQYKHVYLIFSSMDDEIRYPYLTGMAKMVSDFIYPPRMWNQFPNNWIDEPCFKVNWLVTCADQRREGGCRTTGLFPQNQLRGAILQILSHAPTELCKDLQRFKDQIPHEFSPEKRRKIFGKQIKVE